MSLHFAAMLTCARQLNPHHEDDNKRGKSAHKGTLGKEGEQHTEMMSTCCHCGTIDECPTDYDALMSALPYYSVGICLTLIGHLEEFSHAEHVRHMWLWQNMEAHGHIQALVG